MLIVDCLLVSLCHVLGSLKGVGTCCGLEVTERNLNLCPIFSGLVRTS